MQIVAHELDDPLAPFPPLFQDLCRGGSEATAFFTYDPLDPQSFARRAAWLNARGPRPAVRAAVAEALEVYNRRLGAHEEALAAARTLGDPSALAVVTGQQPGLLGGPLYTLLKAATAVRLARDVARQLERPVVAVFWLATEDHDFDEASRVQVVDRRGRLRTLALPRPPGGARRSLGHLPVPPRAESVLRELADALGDGAAGGVDELAEAAAASRSLGEWAGRVLARWLSPFGLVILDPMDAALRRLARGTFAAALLHREAVHRELAAAALRLERRGAVPLLDHGPEHTHLFFYERGQRLALLWRDGRLTDREGRVSLTVSEAARLLEGEPERFSPGVVLRPLVQDHLLPTLAYVAGPSEAQYLAQLREVYRLFGLEMPVVYPRLSLTLVPPAVADALRRHGVGAGEVLADPDGCLRRVLRRMDDPGIDGAVAGLRAAVRRAYDEAREALRPLGSLEGVLEQGLRRVLFQVDYLERKAWQHQRRRHREALRDLEAARAWLRPGGALQERSLAAAQFVLTLGPGFLRGLVRLAPRAGHQVALLVPEEGATGDGLCGVAGDRAASR